MFNIKFNMNNGGVESIVHSPDKDKMNWVEGNATFGTIKNGEVVSVCETDDGIKAIYRTPHLEFTVTRSLKNNVYREQYVIENRLDSDVFVGRGDIGIYTTFNDSYDDAPICMKQRCHAHIWCGENSSYVKAFKMGEYTHGLGLVLTKGSLDAYSVERDLKNESNDRGDFILHPTPFHLLPHAKTVIEWELFWFQESKFRSTLEKYKNAILIDSDKYTVFKGESIEFSINKPNASVFLNGRAIETHSDDSITFVKYTPTELGDHKFVIEANGVKTHALFFVQIPFKELLHNRVRFIVENQQFNCQDSPLDGAYLIYDNEEKRMHFDELDGDRNASRERLVMGLLVAKYLQFFPNKQIYDSLMKYYRFVAREFYDEESGAVYNTIRKNPKAKRLYNAPWMSVFVMEMYKLTGDASYLDKMYKLLDVYYSIGGDMFYPNGLSICESVEALRSAGKTELAEKLTEKYLKHVNNIIKLGVDYPEHEVKYEQTIVTPAVVLIAQMNKLLGDNSLADSCRSQLYILEKFNGDQPSHRLNEMSIRHWDGYWFGKRENYGDTFPHPASIHTTNAYLHYADMNENEEYRKRAYRGARNLLSLFKPDGSASNCYVYPFSVNGVRCEYYDEFANDQDGALYYLMKFYNFHEEN